jgi:transcriptional regulator of aromatic amino acid metabolism
LSARVRVITRARQFAAAGSTILINGETGSGKEMVAQSVHNASQRREDPFVAISCAACFRRSNRYSSMKHRTITPFTKRFSICCSRPPGSLFWET